MCDDEIIAYLYGYEDKNNFTIVELIYNKNQQLYNQLLNCFISYMENLQLYDKVYIKIFNDICSLPIYELDHKNYKYIEHQRFNANFKQYDTGITYSVN